MEIGLQKAYQQHPMQTIKHVQFTASFSCSFMVFSTNLLTTQPNDKSSNLIVAFVLVVQQIYAVPYSLYIIQKQKLLQSLSKNGVENIANNKIKLKRINKLSRFSAKFTSSVLESFLLRSCKFGTLYPLPLSLMNMP